MEVQQVDISSITPYEGNPRRNRNSVGKVADSLKAYGWRQPIVVDEDMVIIAGHTRLLAAKRLKMKEVPIHVAVGLSPEQVRAYRLMDNRSGEDSAWIDDLLKTEIVGLLDAGFDIALTGFNGEQLNMLLSDGDNTEGEDDIPEPGPAITKPGDLWILGDHRLLCGDSIVSDDVSRLMNGSKADMVFMDPPYSLFGNSTGVAAVVDDKMTRPFFRDIFNTCRKNTKLFAHIYTCCDWRSAFSLQAMAKEAKLTEKNLCIWDKGLGGVGAMYQQCYEMIWFHANSPIATTTMGKKKTGERTVNGQPNIWRYARPQNKNHNAQKPVDMVRFAIVNSSDVGGICLDLFLGSGTTIIAAESEGRDCYGLEIEPAYCDIIVKRWEQFTDQEAVLDQRV